MTILRFFLLVLFASLTHEINAQKSETYLRDSFLREIEIRTDTAFFEGLIVTIEEDGRLDKDSKLELLNAATKKVEELDYKLLKGKLDFVKSILKTIEGDYTSAIKLLQPNLQIFEKHNSIYAAMSYNTMGNMVDRMGDKKLAIKYLKKAIELNKTASINEEAKAVQDINNNLVLGNIYFSHDQMDEAEYYFNLADSLSYLDSTSVNKEKCFSLINLAKLELKKGNYELCLKKNNAAMILAKIKNYPDILAFAYLRSGMAYTKLGQYDSALLNYDLAEAITDKNNINTIQLETILQKSKLFREQGYFEKSLAEMDKYIKVKEGLEKQNKTARASYLIAQTQKEEKLKADKEIAALKLEESRKRNNLLIIFSMAFGAIISIVIALRLWRKQSKLFKQEKLEKQIISGQLTAISAQMNPHFIFNSLNSIQDLILKQDSTQAYDYIGKFAMLIRRILDHSEKEFIDMEEEHKILNLYLELEKLRFQEGFKYSIETNGIRDIEIPPMLIQPFVENAIKHGLLHKKGEKNVTISFEQHGEVLKISIEDNGIGREAAQKIKVRQNKSHHSFASQSMHKRLEILQKQYGGNFKVE